ncbi:hypothetical protein [Blastopirellula marina]|uniref:Uncharacterized protein n=1 Tax=Blastopirellula marina TaxID=124 RepID=A0A2S8GTU1_9BACT|nr:hypothetical protein [Blastopirellula marina]PQO47839.1 hypothetical protein C5Y93_02005 [Blastopirellula marina]
MIDDLKPLLQIFDPVPQDLQDYYLQVIRNDLVAKSASAVGLFDPQTCIDTTVNFRSFHPVVSELELLALDDANTSDTHFYSPGMPLPGSVFYLCHDGDSRFVFPNLASYLAAVEETIATGGFVTDHHPDARIYAPDQEQLTQAIRSQYNGESYDELVLVTLIKTSTLSDVDLFSEIATDVDFYLGEAIAEQILAQPSMNLLPVAEACAQHKHPQVSKPGKKAIRAIRELAG